MADTVVEGKVLFDYTVIDPGDRTYRIMVRHRETPTWWHELGFFYRKERAIEYCQALAKMQGPGSSAKHPDVIPAPTQVMELVRGKIPIPATHAASESSDPPVRAGDGTPPHRASWTAQEDAPLAPYVAGKGYRNCDLEGLVPGRNAASIDGRIRRLRSQARRRAAGMPPKRREVMPHKPERSEEAPPKRDNTPSAAPVVVSAADPKTRDQTASVADEKAAGAENVGFEQRRPPVEQPRPPAAPLATPEARPAPKPPIIIGEPSHGTSTPLNPALSPETLAKLTKRYTTATDGEDTPAPRAVGGFPSEITVPEARLRAGR